MKIIKNNRFHKKIKKSSENKTNFESTWKLQQKIQNCTFLSAL